MLLMQQQYLISLMLLKILLQQLNLNFMFKYLKIFSSILFSLGFLFACFLFYEKCVSKKLTKTQVNHLIQADREQINQIKISIEDTTIHFKDESGKIVSEKS